MSVIERLADLDGSYDAIFCDAWGVIHNGLAANNDACLALSVARGRGLPVVILTNAPRTKKQLGEHFTSMGVDNGSYDAIVSSGEVGRDVLKSSGVDKCIHIGPKIDEALFAGVAVRLVSSPSEAELIFATGLRDNVAERASSYVSLMQDFAARDLPMICVNPDKHVHIGHEIRDCAGALAEIYEQAGGKVSWIGKPFPEIYQQAETCLTDILKNRIDPSRILAIGDAVHTDILGASRMGYQTLFVAAGIHRQDLSDANIDTTHPEALAEFCISKGAQPNYFIDALC